MFISVLFAVAVLPARAQNETATPTTVAELLPESEVVDGSCNTPRQAWLQLLWWAGKEKDYVKAAQCFDLALVGGVERGAALSRRLIDYLDSEGRRIDTSNPLTANPDYVDPRTKRAEYLAPQAPSFPIAKSETGRWLFSERAVENIPQASIARRVAGYLPDWFHGEFLGVRLWSYLGVFLLVLVAFTVQRIVVFVIGTYMSRIGKRTGLPYLTKIMGRADRPIGGLCMAAVFFVGFPMLLFPITASQIALIATKALFAFSVVWLAYRLIDVLGDWLAIKAGKTDTKLDDQLVPLLTKSLKVIVSVLGVLFILDNLGGDVASLLAGVGLGGLAFALAAKDTVANFFGSIMIFIDKPFQIGDWVEVDGAEGTVEEVGFRTTRIRTFYNSIITMPNSIITNTKVDNYGARKYRRYSTVLGLTYDTPPEKVQAFCEGVRAIIAQLPGMRKDYYLVEFKEYGDSALQILVYCFMVADSWNDELRTRSNLNLEILRLSHELGVGFAFPTQTLHIDGLVEAGSTKPGFTGTQSVEELAASVRSFGPAGKNAKSSGYQISNGYDCREDHTGGTEASQ